MMETKACTICGVEKPLSDYHRLKGKRCRPACKECSCAAARAWRQANPLKVRAQKKRAYERNPAKFAEKVTGWRNRNPEKYAAQVQRSVERHREKNIRRLREWKAANPERAKESDKRYREQNKAKVMQWTRARQARKRTATPPWASAADMEQVYKAAIAATLATGIPHEVDHIIPLTSPVVCGLHCEANLQVLPQAANRSKGNRLRGEVIEV